MDRDRWTRIQDLFHRIADLPPDEQSAILRAACEDDESLITDVQALLDEDARAGFILDGGVADVAHSLLQTPSTLQVDRIGPYRITGIVGEGGMGVVFRGERPDLGAVAAIKILRDAWLSPARRERFASEQRLLAQLNHPSIARLYDADTLPDGTPWFAMEYVEGVPLTTYCRSRESSIAERLELFREVCASVAHAHRDLIVHRDLKPSNILVTADGHVKLLDFGISRQLEGPDAAVNLTRTGLRLMTPAYAAPEQVRGGRVGLYTDVYALGVILYELLTGRTPFDLTDVTPGEAERIIAEQEPVRPSAVVAGERQGPWRPRLRRARRADWADLDVLCLTAMHKEPGRRYQTVQGLIRDIDHYRNGEPLDARSDSTAYRAGKFVRRHARPLTAAAIAVLALVAISTFYTVRLTTARNEAIAEAARTQRIQRFMLNLFQGGDASVGPADDLRVITLVDRGVQEARSLGSDPMIQAELYETLGTIYHTLGSLEQADTLLGGALEQRRRLHGSSHPVIAETLVALGLLRDTQAKYEEGERLIRQGLEMSRQLLPGDHPAVARATAALGQVLESRGAYEQAIPVLQQAMRLQEANGAADAEVADTITELANTHFYAGHYAESAALNRRAIEMRRQAYGERHPLVADNLINLGAVKYDLGHYAEAEALYRQGLEITEAWFGRNHPDTAAALTMVGRALVSQKKQAEASGLLKDALAINERVYGAAHPRVASTLNEVGKVAQQRGALDEAEACFNRMAAIYRQVHGDKHYLIGIALSNAGSVHLERRDYAGAETLFRDVVRRFTDALSADHLNTGIARIKLGRALVGQRRYREAEGELLAGHGILSKQANPSVSWLKSAREDLVTVYDALGRPEAAQVYRTGT